MIRNIVYALALPKCNRRPELLPHLEIAEQGHDHHSFQVVQAEKLAALLTSMVLMMSSSTINVVYIAEHS